MSAVRFYFTFKLRQNYVLNFENSFFVNLRKSCVISDCVFFSIDSVLFLAFIETVGLETNDTKNNQDEKNIPGSSSGYGTMILPQFDR